MQDLELHTSRATSQGVFLLWQVWQGPPASQVHSVTRPEPCHRVRVATSRCKCIKVQEYQGASVSRCTAQRCNLSNIVRACVLPRSHASDTELVKCHLPVTPAGTWHARRLGAQPGLQKCKKEGSLGICIQCFSSLFFTTAKIIFVTANCMQGGGGRGMGRPKLTR